ncbi:MAG: ATP-dependent protease subunit HslV [Mariprofundaceae bacterium]|nr:ATP-dependent protease subunit HslV [Mariprofundaceae bacterium]
MSSIQMRGTTICAVRRENEVTIAGDGQVTLGDTVMKHGAKKVRKIRNGDILIGFAGSTADAMSLFEMFEAKLDEHAGNLTRAAVALAKEWRTDKYLKKLEAMMIVADVTRTLIISGNGDVLEPDEGVTAIGSGGNYAKSAATALLRHTKLSPRQVAEYAMQIAAETCIYTNTSFTIESLEASS